VQLHRVGDAGERAQQLRHVHRAAATDAQHQIRLERLQLGQAPGQIRRVGVGREVAPAPHLGHPLEVGQGQPGPRRLERTATADQEHPLRAQIGHDLGEATNRPVAVADVATARHYLASRISAART
jgi:hypothetical protein